MAVLRVETAKSEDYLAYMCPCTWMTFSPIYTYSLTLFGFIPLELRNRSEARSSFCSLSQLSNIVMRYGTPLGARLPT